MSRKIPKAAWTEMARMGGNKTKETKPPEYWREIGAKGNEAIKEKYKGTDFFKERAKKATAARLKKQQEKKEAEAKSKSPLHKLTDILSGK